MDTDSEVNIKPTKEQLSFLYDILYEEAYRIFEETQICNNCKYEYRCCFINNKECEYHSKEGCTVRSLGCKIYLCLNMIERYPEAYVKLKILKDIAIKYGIYHPLLSKEDVLKRIE